MLKDNRFLDWFRHSTPYIHAHRDKTFVVCFGGEALEQRESFSHLIHDIALLQGLGVRLVLVHGARPQIEERLRLRGAQMRIHNGLRITDEHALTCVKEAAGFVRVEIEAQLSTGLANTPMAGIRIRAASGNFVTAQPLGVRDGVDFCHTGQVRKVDGAALRKVLAEGAIALIPPLGYSPTGEVFNLAAPDLAAAIALELHADKLIYLQEEDSLRDEGGATITHLLPIEADELLVKRIDEISEECYQQIFAASDACRRGIKRVHLLQRGQNGVLLQELFTREGVGTIITASAFETLRTARIDDVGGILNLLEPLEQAGVLVKRSRELLETEIDRFVLMLRDEAIIACAALYPYPEEHTAELACVAVHPDYRDAGRGDALLQNMEAIARNQGLRSLFVLTTQTAHWFQERGFTGVSLDDLPRERQRLYNFQRNSKLFRKPL
ncbi:MAG: amino-acid N-acetyltransferase [Gammaproteobacteria bacterium SHHR-1]|uniref:amino-acid N-acetyltransferase n=1 Tax=Magnetovirga frankeli TaxID=947516 RepID=UPI0012939D17|nr:amino-acid N-acetyltransferase [gamma proteobacterium SS-5]